MAKHNKAYWISIFFTIALAFFIWMSWKKLNNFIGNDTVTWLVAGGIVLVGLWFGQLKLDNILKRIG